MADDVKAKAIITVDADTSSAVKNINKLTDAQKDMGKGFESSAGSISKFIGSAADGFAKLGLAVVGVEKVFGMLNGAIDSVNESIKRENMEKMLPSGALEKLSSATDHLISRQDTLRLSVRGMTGDFKITEDQMAKVLQASVALAQKGLGPASEIADKLLDGIAGKTGKLDDLGIAFTKTGSAAQDAAELFSKMDEIIGDPNNAVDQRTKDMAALKDAFVGLGQGIEDALASVVHAIGSVIHATGEALKIFDREEEAMRKRARDQETWRTNAGKRGAVGIPGTPGAEDLSNDYFPGVTAPKKRFIIGYDGHGDPIYADAGGFQLPKEEPSYGFGGAMDSSAIDTALRNATSPEERAALERARQERLFAEQELARQNALNWGTFFQGQGAYQGSIGGEFYNPKTWVRPGGALGSAEGITIGRPEGLRGLYGGQSFFGNEDLAKLAKRPPGFAEKTGDMLKTDAFSALSSGINAAVQAAVDGSDAIGKAAAKASAAVLKSLAVEATGRAIFEGAMALGSLAIGDIKGATTHGLAAAQFAVAAGVTGSLAAGLGALAGGGSAGTSAGAGAPAGGGFGSPTGGTSSQGPINVTVNVGYGFDGDPKKLGDAVYRGIRQAQLAGTRSGNYATQVSG